MKYNVKLRHSDGAICCRGRIEADCPVEAIRKFAKKKYQMNVEDFAPQGEIQDNRWEMQDIDADGAEGYFEAIPVKERMKIKCSIREISSVERRDTVYSNLEVKIGNEEFMVEGDDRSGWDEDCTSQVDEYLSEIGSKLTFDNLFDRSNNSPGDEFEISVVKK
jgi:hypothetical protein